MHVVKVEGQEVRVVETGAEPWGCAQPGVEIGVLHKFGQVDFGVAYEGWPGCVVCLAVACLGGVPSRGG